MEATTCPTATSVTFLQDDYTTLAYKEFQCLRASRELCDVVLCVEDSQIVAHRVVLAASSPYFRAMFSVGMAESFQKDVFLSDLDGKAVRQIVDFFYCGKIVIDDDNVQSLLYAACLLTVNAVKQFCCEYLEQETSVINCLGIRDLSESLSCYKLFEAANSFAIAHFSQVLRCEEFLLQSYESLCALIVLDYLDITGESELLDGVLNWLHWDNANRSTYAYTLLKRLHLMQVPINRLQDLLTDPIITSDADCMGLVLGNIETLQSKNVVSACEFPMFMNRIYGKAKEMLFAIGGESAGVILDSAECYDMECCQWDWKISVRDSEPVLLPTLCQSRNQATTSSTGHHVYVIGGSHSWEALDVVERYEWPENKWHRLSSLNQERLGAGSAISNGRLLAVGGCGKKGYLSSVESYDPLVDKWTIIEPMKLCRGYPGVAELNGYVYAAGGFGGVSGESDSWMSSVECFFSSSNLWVPVAPMLQPRAYFGLVTEGGSLYALGGYNSSWLSASERFDPREGHWYSFPSMISPRSSGGASSVNNLLYVAGGFDGVKNLNSVESFDTRAGKWMEMNPMRTVRFGMSLATLRL